MPADYILDFSSIRLHDIGRVGGKNASLGELYAAFNQKDVGVLDGFAITTDAYWRLLEENKLRECLEPVFANLNCEDMEQLATAGRTARSLLLRAPLPQELCAAIINGYRNFVRRVGHEPSLAVRSSANAEDLPEASFAGAAETFLNLHGEKALLRAVHQCFASLFTDRAISYRARQGYPQLQWHCP